MTSQDDIIAYMKVIHHQYSYLCYSLSCYYTYHVQYEGSVVFRLYIEVYEQGRTSSKIGGKNFAEFVGISCTHHILATRRPNQEG